MEQQIRFCTTPDGTQLAYAMYDEGDKAPLVVVGGWAISQELAWELPEGRAFYERLAQGRQLLTFDRRGVGASQREVEDLSVDAQLSDLVALVDHVKLARFDVLSFHGGLTVPFAAQNPERVRRLILWAPTAGAEEEGTTRLQDTRTMSEMVRSNWQWARRSIADFYYPNGPLEQQRWISSVLRESISPETLARYLESHTTKDIGPFLSRVRSPTLVLHRRDDHLLPISAGRAIAAGISDARFVALEGDIATPLADDHLQIAELIVQFLDEGQDEQAPAVAVPTGLVTILFVDIAGSTALTERLGDAAYRAMERGLDASLRTAIREAGGTPIEGKVLGDGVMAVFTSARQAIDCALRCRIAGAAADLPLHLGVHAGDVIREGNNVHGGAVQLAARIADASAPGEILVSETLRGLARTSADVAFEERGERELAGIAEPQRVYAVQVPDGSQ